MNKTNKQWQIGVIGSAGKEEYPNGGSALDAVLNDAREIGRLLAEENCIVVTGGKGGIMEAVSQGANEKKGKIVGVIKGTKRFTSNPYVNWEVLTGMEADGFDEFILVMMCDAFIVLGGGAGTLQEITIAYRNNKPIIILDKTGGWSDKLNLSYLDERQRVEFIRASDPKEAVRVTLEQVKKKYE